MIRMTNIVKRYDGGRTTALAIDALDIADGANVAILGRSGSGKSTLLNLLSGLDTPDSGEILLRGRRLSDPRAWAEARAGSIGMVFQNFCLLAEFSARENILLGMMPIERDARTRGRRADELIERFGLAHVADKFPPVLSGGERQRIAIARAIANRPALLLADEPTGSLDSATGAIIMDSLHELNAKDGCSLIVVTHDETVAARAARRVVLKDGRIETDSTMHGART